jgi:hypothetical protein
VKERDHAELPGRLSQFGQAHGHLAAMLNPVSEQVDHLLPERQVKWLSLRVRLGNHLGEVLITQHTAPRGTSHIRVIPFALLISH